MIVDNARETDRQTGTDIERDGEKEKENGTDTKIDKNQTETDIDRDRYTERVTPHPPPHPTPRSVLVALTLQNGAKYLYRTDKNERLLAQDSLTALSFHLSELSMISKGRGWEG